jgi:LCP family protein required for cell wall assembly
MAICHHEIYAGLRQRHHQMARRVSVKGDKLNRKVFGKSSLASSRRMERGSGAMGDNNADNIDISKANTGKEYADSNYSNYGNHSNYGAGSYGSSGGGAAGGKYAGGSYTGGNAGNYSGSNYGYGAGGYGSNGGNSVGNYSNNGGGNYSGGSNYSNYGYGAGGYGNNGGGPASGGNYSDGNSPDDYNNMKYAAYDAGYRAAMDDMRHKGRRGNYDYGAGSTDGSNFNTGGGGYPPQKAQKKRKHHPIRNFFLMLFLIVVVGVAVLGVMGASMYNRLMKAVEPSIDYGFRNTEQTLNDGVAYDESMMGKRSIALVGIDSRDGDLLSGNSDTMIVATVDDSKRSVKMFSVYRDTYLDVVVGEAVYRKANNAYATGGPSRMVTMLNRNLDLNITDYVTVDFKALQVAVDDLGGIDVEMTDNEVVWMNDNGWETAEVCGVKWWYVEPGAGTYHLNGVQAVSYARIRKTTGNDFKRTSRQRLVISKILDKAKHAGPAALMKMAEDVLPLIRTSLNEKDLTTFALQVILYGVDSAQGFPFVHLESDVKGLDVVVPVTLEHNVKELHKWLFGVEDYAPSKTVRDISSYIASASGFDESDIERAADYSANGANPDSGSEADGH